MIKLDNVGKDYRIEGEYLFSALKNINLTINDGDFVSIVGPSGCGKSTLMHILGLLDKPTSGKVLVNNQNVSRLNDNQLSSLRNEFVGFVFQQFNLIPKLTVRENILLPTIYSRKEFTYDPNQRVHDLLSRFGLLDKEKSYPNKLSGGQQQRVAIARALIMNPQVILADEPTGNLDSRTGKEIMEVFKKLNDTQKITVVIVTHAHEIAKITRRKIAMKDGRIIRN